MSLAVKVPLRVAVGKFCCRVGTRADATAHVTQPGVANSITRIREVTTTPRPARRAGTGMTIDELRRTQTAVVVPYKRIYCDLITGLALYASHAVVTRVPPPLLVAGFGAVLWPFPLHRALGGSRRNPPGPRERACSVSYVDETSRIVDAENVEQ